MKDLVRAVIASAILATGITHVQAHDIRGILKDQSQSASGAIAEALAATPTSDESARSVLNNLRLWPAKHTLTICFVEGSTALRKRVSDTMQRTWNIAKLTDRRLRFDEATFAQMPDCGSTPSADIRVAFKALDGHWSYVGAESTLHTPSMNFDNLSETTPEQTEFDRIVAHETGHALGLEHEHQSPAAPKDCGWNFKYIRTHFQWKSDKEMLDNFAKLQDYISNDKHAYIYSTYDKKSIMHYYFEPDAFLSKTDRPCMIDQNYTPSAQDQRAITVAYGPHLAEEQERVRGGLPTILQRFSGPTGNALRSLLDAKVRLLEK